MVDKKLMLFLSSVALTLTTFFLCDFWKLFKTVLSKYGANHLIPEFFLFMLAPAVMETEKQRFFLLLVTVGSNISLTLLPGSSMTISLAMTTLFSLAFLVGWLGYRAVETTVTPNKEV